MKKEGLHEALDAIEGDLGKRKGKEALSGLRGTAAVKAPQEPGVPSKSGGELKNDPKQAEGAPEAESKHEAEGAVKQYMAKGYSPQEQGDHLKEHWHSKVHEMVTKHLT